MSPATPTFAAIVGGSAGLLATTRTKARGPEGSLPLTPAMLEQEASGTLFGMTQDAGMGWDPADVARPQILIVSTMGGLRGDDGRPVALGYHTGHWEIGLLVRAAAETLREQGVLPFAAYCSDPCDGRTQGTPGMFDSLAYRNDAAITMRRLIRSLPRRTGVIGIATCDKGLPATLLALAGCRDLPGIVVPGGVTLPAIDAEDAGRVQSIGARFAHGLITLEHAAAMGCRACGTPGGGCQFLGTAATAQIVSEALGLSLPHSALAPSGEPVWLDMARRSALAAVRLAAAGTRSRTPCSCTRPSADRRTSCCTFPPWPTRRVSPGPASKTGRASTAPCRGWWTRSRTGRVTTRRCRCSWRGAYPR
jgi:dihydroxyacid dehydratase/phosphogluconate dehydratase